MSPHLRNPDLDAILARLDAAGDAQAADALRGLRAALAAQDEALRDLVADAREINEDHDEAGSSVDIKCAEGGFDRLCEAFGYPAIQGIDRAEVARAETLPGGPEMYDGLVHLSPLDHLLARIWAEARRPDDLAALGYREIEITRPGGIRETLPLAPRETPAPAPTP